MTKEVVAIAPYTFLQRQPIRLLIGGQWVEAASGKTFATLNPATREARVHGAPVALSARELALLEALLARPGAILSRAQLEDKLYGWSDPVESNAVEVHIHSLRRKLGADLIRNVRGVGWMVAKPDAVGASEQVPRSSA